MNENVMMMRRAKEQLANKWINVAIGTLIYVAINAVASYTYVLAMLLYGPLTFGYYLYLACNVDTGVNNLNLLFKGFERFTDTLVAGLLYFLAVSIGTFFLIVPGIIAALGFSMTFFIMVDDPNISGIDALQKSWNMMNGQKWNLFCLWIRFFGWALLCILTCGIGSLFLNPYIVVTTQNFYRKLRYGTF
ncbi:MAG: DUF975 family protein [Muribaculaceae bacterium]|nr:DUF975 family protein [Muribaculaceae bacterium]